MPSFAGVAADDYEQIGKIGRAIIDILTVELMAADIQIKACTGQ